MKHKILVVDDEEEIRKTIRLQLEETAFEIIEAENGEEGIRVLEFMKEGVVEYLVKPVEKNELLAAVTKAAEQRSLFGGTQTKM